MEAPRRRPPGGWRAQGLPLAAAAVVFLVDRATKVLVERYFSAWRITHPAAAPSVPLLGDAVRLTYAPNPGSIFGFLQRTALPHRAAVLTAVTVVALAFLAAYYARIPPGRRRLAWGTALVLGGAVGNLVDRVLYGHVIDFVDVSLGFTRWYVFNVADAAITCGVALMALDALGRREE